MKIRALTSALVILGVTSACGGAPASSHGQRPSAMPSKPAPTAVYRTVPVVRGISLDVAMRRLHASGFALINVAETGKGAMPGTVTEQYPGGGSNWSTSDSINLTVVPTK